MSSEEQRSDVDPALERAAEAYEAGDHVEVRRQLVAVGDDLDGAQREQLARLRARTEVDPVVAGVLVACLALLCVVAFVYVL